MGVEQGQGQERAPRQRLNDDNFGLRTAPVKSGQGSGPGTPFSPSATMTGETCNMCMGLGGRMSSGNTLN